MEMPQTSLPFSGRPLVLATMHGKETVMAPLLEAGLGVRVVVAEGLNTDAYGTFSGEIERTGTPLDAARQKVAAALDATGHRLGVASEGSFGPHPALPFLYVDAELVLLVDRETGREWTGEAVSTDTNFGASDVRAWEEIEEFARRARFPDHGLILKSTGGALVKGLRDWETLRREADRLLAAHQALTVETDMRAMHNPLRMGVIAEATRKLVAKLQTPCPVCAAPGFALAERLPGLPCDHCGFPTRLPRAERWACGVCGLAEERPAAETYADPRYCDFCNP